MIISTHNKFIINKFLKSFFKVMVIFISLTLIMNLFEEVSFFKDSDATFFMPIYLTIINLPSLLFEIFPFIFLITGIIFFIEIIDHEEHNTLKIFGINNSNLLIKIGCITFLISFLLITIFYHLSANLKFVYIDIKNQYSKDDKYLAVVTANGLWIKDTQPQNTNFINAEKIIKNTLKNVLILSFNNQFELVKTIKADYANVKNKEWVLSEVTINSSNVIEKKETINFESNIDSEKIFSIFNNFTALNLFRLKELKRDYILLGYSIKKIDLYVNKIYSYPLYLTLMVIIGSILMLNVKFRKSKIFHITAGILLSVIIYYFNKFFSVYSESKNVSFIMSVWGPQFILLIFTTINLVKINER
ncbi:LptF/LptG family permease [Candidatus Pelagibacter sp.]|nr:LptF/LptG family permease [Candidatus Pelagibacter sp.]